MLLTSFYLAVGRIRGKRALFLHKSLDIVPFSATTEFPSVVKNLSSKEEP